MKIVRLSLAVLALSVFRLSTAEAQAFRTWVSGVGDDVNPCSRTAPCKTFAGAISKTAAGGEIDALDPAGFGAVTITKAMTIDGGGGQVASILVSGTNGVSVQAGMNDVVTLKNLSINGVGSGINGVKFVSGKALHIEHCTFANFSNNGVDIEPLSGGLVFVVDTISRANGASGLFATTTMGYAQVTIDNSHFDDNVIGVSAGDNTRFAIKDSGASGNSQVGFLAEGNSGMAVISISNSIAGNNAIGMQAGGGAAASSIRIAACSIFLNLTGLTVGTNGTISSFGNNYNSGSGRPNGSIALQ